MHIPHPQSYPGPFIHWACLLIAATRSFSADARSRLNGKLLLSWILCFDELNGGFNVSWYVLNGKVNVALLSRFCSHASLPWALPSRRHGLQLNSLRRFFLCHFHSLSARYVFCYYRQKSWKPPKHMQTSSKLSKNQQAKSIARGWKAGLSILEVILVPPIHLQACTNRALSLRQKKLQRLSNSVKLIHVRNR